MYSKVKQQAIQLFSRSDNPHNMTTGNTLQTIIQFAIPLLISNLFLQLYGSVDSVVVGHFLGKSSITAIGTVLPLITLLSSVFIGVCNGAIIMISQYCGNQDNHNLGKTISTLYMALYLCAIPISIFGIIFIPKFLQVLSVPTEAYNDACIYGIILFISLIASLGSSANAIILQGMGNSKAPLVTLSISCMINVVLDVVFVTTLKLGIAGIALATVIAQFTGWFYGMRAIKKNYRHLNIRFFSLRFSKAVISKMMRLGIPAIFLQISTNLCVLILQKLANGFGTSFSAGFNIANNIDTLIFLPIQSLALAITAFTGQNLGANNKGRIKEGIRYTLYIGIGLSVLSLLILPCSSFLMRIFTNESEVIASGQSFLYRILPFYWILAIVSIISGAMQGMGKILIATLSNMLSLWLVCLLVAFAFAGMLGQENINYSYGISWVFNLVLLFIYIRQKGSAQIFC